MSPEPENVLFVFRVTLRFILSFAPRFLLTLVGLLYPPTADKSHTNLLSPRQQMSSPSTPDTSSYLCSIRV